MYMYKKKTPKHLPVYRYEFKIRVNNEIYCKPIFIRGDFISRSTADKQVRSDQCPRPSLIQTCVIKTIDKVI